MTEHGDTDDESPTDDRSRDAQLYTGLASGAVALVAVGTVVYHWLEDWSWVDSFYFSVVAVTTVGFGDLSPTTDVSKLFTVVYIVLGVSIVATYLDARFKRAVSKRSSRNRRS
jgi:hypothetical protein